MRSHPRLYLLATGIVTVSSLWWFLTERGVAPVFRIFSFECEKVPAAVDLPWRGSSVDRVDSLLGSIKDHVEEKLGKPNQTYEFSVEDGVDEFRIELLNTYPPGSARAKGVLIREWQWKYSTFSVAVWFHLVDGRWVVLDTCRWKKGVLF